MKKLLLALCMLFTGFAMRTGFAMEGYEDQNSTDCSLSEEEFDEWNGYSVEEVEAVNRKGSWIQPHTTIPFKFKDHSYGKLILEIDSETSKNELLPLDQQAFDFLQLLAQKYEDRHPSQTSDYFNFLQTINYENNTLSNVIKEFKEQFCIVDEEQDSIKLSLMIEKQLYCSETEDESHELAPIELSAIDRQVMHNDGDPKIRVNHQTYRDFLYTFYNYTNDHPYLKESFQQIFRSVQEGHPLSPRVEAFLNKSIPKDVVPSLAYIEQDWLKYASTKNFLEYEDHKLWPIHEYDAIKIVGRPLLKDNKENPVWAPKSGTTTINIGLGALAMAFGNNVIKTYDQKCTDLKKTRATKAKKKESQIRLSMRDRASVFAKAIAHRLNPKSLTRGSFEY